MLVSTLRDCGRACEEEEEIEVVFFDRFLDTSSSIGCVIVEVGVIIDDNVVADADDADVVVVVVAP